MNKRLLMLAVLAFATAPPLAVAQQLQHELLVFPSLEVVRSSGLAEPNDDLDDELLSADVLFSLQQGPFRVFAEYLLTNHEADLERLQFGWEPSADTTIWVGRFHQASSVWNHEHHHGRFLQTTITRPVIENWEDDEGIIPQHFLGVLVEQNWHLSDGHGIHAALGGGLAPIFENGRLAPFDVIHPDVNEHQLGFQARLSYLPDELGETGFGLLLAHNEINWADAPPPEFASATHVDQSVLGGFGTLIHEPWALSAVAYYIDAKVVGTVPAPGTTDTFLAGYAQLERAFPHDFTVFGRYEDTSNAEDVPFLQLFPDYVVQRAAIGVRWAIARRHALSLELADSSSVHDHYEEFRLQWSTALFWSCGD